MSYSRIYSIHFLHKLKCSKTPYASLTCSRGSLTSLELEANNGDDGTAEMTTRNREQRRREIVNNDDGDDSAAEMTTRNHFREHDSLFDSRPPQDLEANNGDDSAAEMTMRIR